MITLYFIGILCTFYVLYVVVDKFLIPTIYILKDKIGLTDDQTGALTSFVSSAPELSVSIISLIIAIQSNDAKKFEEIAALGPAAVIGSALFSVLFIVGASAWFAGKKLTWHSITRDMVYYIFAVLALFFTLSNGKVEWYEGIVLLLLYVVYAVIVSNWPKISSKLLKLQPTLIKSTVIIAEDVKDSEEKLIHLRDQKWSPLNAIEKLSAYLFFSLKSGYNGFQVSYNIIISVFLVIVSSYFMVEWASQLAVSLKVPQAIIGLTILAAGTSVPDLLASIKTAREGYADTAVTNAIGSNVFDVLGNLGLTWTIAAIFRVGAPVAVDTNSLNGSIVLLIASSVVLLLLLFAKKFNLSRPVSIFLMASYICYVAVICFQSLPR